LGSAAAGASGLASASVVAGASFFFTVFLTTVFFAGELDYDNELMMIHKENQTLKMSSPPKISESA
jgi:hypothetical protein